MDVFHSFFDQNGVFWLILAHFDRNTRKFSKYLSGSASCQKNFLLEKNIFFRFFSIFLSVTHFWCFLIFGKKIFKKKIWGRKKFFGPKKFFFDPDPALPQDQA